MSSSDPSSEEVETPMEDGKGECPGQVVMTTATEEAPDELKEKNFETASSDEQEYPALPRLIMIMCSMCLCFLCVAMDDMIITTAIPRMTDEFKALRDVGWYGSAYLLSSSTMQMLYGRLYGIYPIIWVYLIALALFEAGSLLCGVTPNSDGFILGRTLAGAGAAGINTATALGVMKIAPLQRRPMLMGIMGSIYTLASVASPLIGGAFTTRVTWRWCFYINLPIGGAAALGLLIFFPHDKKKNEGNLSLFQHIKRLDLESTIVFSAGVLCLMLALEMGGSVYAWRDARIIVLFILGPIFIMVFCGFQVRKQEKAMFPPSLVKNRAVWTAVLFAGMFGGAFFCVPYYLPIWFQAIDAASAVDSALRCLPFYVSATLSVILNGVICSCVGYYTPLMILSSIFMAVGAGMLSTLKVDTAKGIYIGYQIIFGAGVGIGIQQPFIAIQKVLADSDVAMGTALVDLTQTLGGAIALTVSQTVFQRKLVNNLDSVHIPGLNGNVVADAGATEISSLVPQQYLYRVLVEYNAALRFVFVVGAAMAVVSAGFAFLSPWLSIKEEKSAMDTTDATEEQVSE